VGEELSGCRWVGVPFAGGMSELAHIDAAVVMVNDLHRAVVNLAMVAADPTLGPRLYRRLRRLPFHDELLARAQAACRAREGGEPAIPDLDWAADYYVACWMGRSAKGGTTDEFNGRSAKRWNANGGGSAVRYGSAVRSLPVWRQILRRCEFSVMDAFEFLDRCEDASRHGIYCDPPFPGPGEKYRHKFTEAQHRQLAKRLAEFDRARVVCRFYDHPLVRELYPEGAWTWRRMTGRKQSNADAPEVLILNGPSRATSTDKSLF